MVKNVKILKIIAFLFVLIIFLGFIKNDTYNAVDSYAKYLGQGDSKAEGALSKAGVELSYTSSIWKKRELIDINGFMAARLNMHGLYSNKGIYVTNDKYIVSSSPQTTTDYEVEETIGFRDFLKSNGINLLYVNEPTKYTDDDLFKNEFGIKTYSNTNMDLFLSRIREAGINYIDLRENISKDGMDVSELFYRTDHHWTTPAGLWAAKIIAEGLNEYCGYKINTSVLEDRNFKKNQWEDCWLGEQGRLVGKTYVGLDDYTELKPEFDTDFTFKNDDGTTYDGTFDAFVNEAYYNTENDVYENGSWHYSYNLINCVNNDVEKGKVLMLVDSYDHVTQPFISLVVHEVDYIELRNYDDSFNLRDYIIENGYDTVIIAYAQFMLGAHDDSSSANYRMFSFDH